MAILAKKRQNQRTGPLSKVRMCQRSKTGNESNEKRKNRGLRAPIRRRLKLLEGAAGEGKSGFRALRAFLCRNPLLATGVRRWTEKHRKLS